MQSRDTARPGLILHNGKSSKDSILAAAVEEPQRATSTYEFNLNSVGDDGKMVREEFEWRKLKKGNDDVKGRATWPWLYWSNQELGSSVLSPPGGETVALLEWPKGLSSLVYVFSLQLTGSGDSNALGQRWALMVVMTALRFWWLNVGGRANTAVIDKGKEIHHNQSVP
ncbi:hypothetical protein ACJ73_10326 [Blastomyces percursus]|uniref:Uncharacterized protein n=1 Tax=Blastomyces percursus TaxID=1658174 RepID=A0A1J9PNK3_9EURO|nr:hypothetical protein ACJ73_10326 [Blastomyces percursus]